MSELGIVDEIDLHIVVTPYFKLKLSSRLMGEIEDRLNWEIQEMKPLFKHLFIKRLEIKAGKQEPR